MSFVFWLVIIVVVYFFLVFVVLRLVAPFMGFRQYTPPADLPADVRGVITQLENKSSDANSYLEAVYGWVLGRWEHSRFKAAIFLSKLFKKDLQKIWQTKGFIYCTSINFIVYTLLANSKFFEPEDVKVKHVFLNFVPHQYLQVKVGDKFIDVDPAGAGIRGFGIGHHASFFG